MPTISVIVPVYKVEPYLRRCIDSILAQTFTDFELILIDDGSPDNCGKVCDEYAAMDNRIYVIHQKNGGLSAARNAGIDWVYANSDSRWLTFIDSDDWVHSEYLQRLYNAAVENDSAVSICGYAETDGEEPEIKDDGMVPQLWTPEDFYVEHNVNAIVAWGKLYRKGCFQTIRYPVGKIHEDEYVTYRILFVEEKLAVVSAPLYFYYINTDGITKKAWSLKRLDAIEAYEQQLIYMRKYQYLQAYKKCVCNYACFLAVSFQRVQEKFPLNKTCQRNIKKRLRELLHKSSDVLVLEQNYYVYELAFPLEMTIYWYWKAVIRRLKRNA